MLGNNPIIFVKGHLAPEYQQVYDAGLTVRNGTEEQQASMLRMIDGMEKKEYRLQQEQTKFPSRSK